MKISKTFDFEIETKSRKMSDKKDKSDFDRSLDGITKKNKGSRGGRNGAVNFGGVTLNVYGRPAIWTPGVGKSHRQSLLNYSKACNGFVSTTNVVKCHSKSDEVLRLIPELQCHKCQDVPGPVGDQMNRYSCIDESHILCEQINH